MEWIALITAALKGLGALEDLVSEIKSLNLAQRLQSIEEKQANQNAAFSQMAAASTVEEKQAALHAIIQSW